MFQKSVRAKNGDPTVEFFRLAGAVYDPTKNPNVEQALEEGGDDEDLEIFDEF
jgi:hypothetical protein